MEEKEISPALYSFIEKERWDYPFRLTSNIEVQKDLKITGDDAVEFIIAFGKEFNVDVSQFKAADYFADEGVNLISWICNLLKENTQVEQKVLTLGDLDKAIISRLLV